MQLSLDCTTHSRYKLISLVEMVDRAPRAAALCFDDMGATLLRIPGSCPRIFYSLWTTLRRTTFIPRSVRENRSYVHSLRIAIETFLARLPVGMTTLCTILTLNCCRVLSRITSRP